MADDVMFRDATGQEVTYGRAMFSYVSVIVTIFGGIIFTIIGINNGWVPWTKPTVLEQTRVLS